MKLNYLAITVASAGALALYAQNKAQDNNNKSEFWQSVNMQSYATEQIKREVVADLYARCLSNHSQYGSKVAGYVHNACKDMHDSYIIKQFKSEDQAK